MQTNAIDAITSISLNFMGVFDLSDDFHEEDLRIQ